jgi:hypothetical protein
MNGCCRRILAFGLSLGSIWNHHSRKLTSLFEMFSGNLGGVSLLAILNNTAYEFSHSDQGGYPWTISITVHPTLQMSEYRQWILFLITSGAIHCAVPIITLSICSSESINLFEPPKSANFHTPLLSTNTFAPLNVSMDYIVGVKVV